MALRGRHVLARCQPQLIAFFKRQDVCYSTMVEAKPLTWVFLGPPGVGKGTYSTRVANAFGFTHIATGDLVRDEIKQGTPLGKQMAEIVNSGHLLPDDIILRALNDKFHSTAAGGVHRFLLDGFPRSVPQASALEEIADVQLAVNLDLRHEVLVEKCMGRRICKHCGKNYNIADINLPAGNGRPAIVMPPLSAPPECEPHLEQRADDTEETILKRLEVYNAGAKPVEDFYRHRGMLFDFEITAGIPETLPGLLDLLRSRLPKQEHTQAATA